MIKISVNNNEFIATVSVSELDEVSLSTRNDGTNLYDVCVIGTRKQTVRIDSALRDREQAISNPGSVRGERNEEAITLSIQRVRA